MYGNEFVKGAALNSEETKANEMTYYNLISIMNNQELRSALTEEEANVIKRAIIRHALEEATCALTVVKDNDKKISM